VPDSTELNIVDVTEPQDLAAGDFAAWLRRTLTAFKVNGEADVPCGSCNACCRSGYFIHIGRLDVVLTIPGKAQQLSGQISAILDQLFDAVQVFIMWMFRVGF
jgi:hypothetical protein